VIKVLINGTPIYRLEFHRRKYKTVKRKGLTAGQIIAKLQRLPNLVGSHGVSLTDVEDGIRAAFEAKPLYETTALIYIIDAKGDEPPVATATSRQSKADDNRKIVGRGVALNKLLHLQKDDTLPVFSAVERKAIRDAYNNRAKRTTKPLPPGGSAGSPPIAQIRKTPVVGKVLEFNPRPSLTLAA
jgi:hypothetical protein